jgi:FKBP-type peptidyl-prolyl cis-trans isomerase
MKTFSRAVAMTAIAFMPIVVSSCTVDADTNPLVPIEQTNFASSLGVNLAASTKTANGAYYRDIVTGTGATVTTGQLVSVRYTGYFADGTIFDSNTTAASPLPFRLGSGDVIEGWDEALAGVKVGSTRQLIIPPSLGYGPYDYGPIPGNSVLVFNVQVISAQ